MTLLPRITATIALLVLALLAPQPVLLALLGVLVAGLLAEAGTSGLRSLGFVAPLLILTLAFNVLLVPLLYDLAGWTLTWNPWAVGVTTALRLGVAAGAATWFQATTSPRDLRRVASALPRTGVLLMAAHRLVPTLRRDAAEVRDAQRARGHDPGTGLRAAARAAPLVTPLLVRTVRRGVTAGQALRASGLGGRHRLPWGPVVALASLAAATRLAFLWAPNVTPAFLVVFVAGVAYGVRAGAVAGGAAMVATDLALSGLHPTLLANALAMGALGAGGGLLRRLDLGRSPGEPTLLVAGLSALLGAAAVLLYSVVNDTVTWALFYGVGAGVWDSGVLAGLVLLGLAFNAIPAAVNAVLFATASAPALHALDRAGLLEPSPIPITPATPREDARPPGLPPIDGGLEP